MDRKKVSKWVEIVITILFIAILAFGPLAFGGVRLREFVIIQWLTVVVIVAWMAQIWVAPKFRLLFPPPCWAVLPAVAYAVWRYRTADVEYAARADFIQILVMALLFLVFVTALYSQERIQWIIIALIGVATFVAMYGVYQWLSGSERVWGFYRGGYEGRGSGTYISPNHFSGFLEMVLPVTLMVIVTSRFKALSRVLMAYAAGCLTIGIACSGSRAGWVATAVATLLVALSLVRSRKQWWAALAILLVVVGIGSWLYGRVLHHRVELPHASGKFDDIRFDIWRSAGSMWADYPFFGVGPNHFDIRYREYRREHWSTQMRPGYVHNDYLNTLTDWGACGLVLFLLPVGLAVAGLAQSWIFLRRTGADAHRRGGNRFGFAAGAAIGLAALVVHSFFDFNLHIPANAIVAAVLMAIITVHWRFATERYWMQSRWWVKAIATAIVAMAAFYLSSDALARGAEARALAKAEDAEPASPAEIAALKRAWTIQPTNFETAYQVAARLRARAFMGGDDSQALAREALEWYRRALALNRWHSQASVGAGMCLDWLEQPREAEPYFTKAVQLDPNNAFIRAAMGWHYFQVEDYPRAIDWMQRALKVDGYSTLAGTYLPLAQQRLAAARQTNSPPTVPSSK